MQDRRVRSSLGDMSQAVPFPLGSPLPEAIAQANQVSYEVAASTQPSAYGTPGKKMLRITPEGRANVLRRLSETNGSVHYDPITGTAMILAQRNDVGGVAAVDGSPNMLEILAYVLGQGSKPSGFGRVAPSDSWVMPHGSWVYVRFYASGGGVMPMVILSTSPVEPEPCAAQFGPTNNAFGCDLFELLVPREKLMTEESEALLSPPGFFAGMSPFTFSVCAAAGAVAGLAFMSWVNRKFPARGAAQ